MTALSESVDLARHGRIAVLTIDNPPANALSHHVRKGRNPLSHRNHQGGSRCGPPSRSACLLERCLPHRGRCERCQQDTRLVA